ncbi:MAG: hypothetical protein LCH63_07165 [Candidatus Melainabacteria bacterium]|uniref:Tetratricopeptide repeat protein n=1 Tax=Candidatus Obscuribacter phosphatis TaxID=1906157 RepID=A0A8J7PCR8_9BACT|nr:hypothetical protein [Candidatus Obscuribacter phosphatis]MCA0313607.1 hypothetical protein [Candidatus Melainabacteria bacterium]
MNRLSLVGAAAVVIAATAGLAVNANEVDQEFIVDTSPIGKSTHGVVTSDQFLELGVPTANSLRIEGEQSLRMGKLDRAIMVLQRSVEMAPMDMDGRILYAEALEKKLIKQKEKRDPALYNFVVKQWLFVAKNAEFADQGMQGFQHLYKIAGTVPKKFEKEKKYLERVLIREDGTEKVILGKKPTPANL